MASRDGARALGRRTGQIVPGYTADLILVDFDRPSLTPPATVWRTTWSIPPGGPTW